MFFSGEKTQIRFGADTKCTKLSKWHVGMKGFKSYQNGQIILLVAQSYWYLHHKKCQYLRIFISILFLFPSGIYVLRNKTTDIFDQENRHRTEKSKSITA
jgi:hypothetical protein